MFLFMKFSVQSKPLINSFSNKKTLTLKSGETASILSNGYIEITAQDTKNNKHIT